MKRFLLLSIACLAVTAPTASAGVTLTGPANGGETGPHPTFSWTVDDGTLANELVVHSVRDVGKDGALGRGRILALNVGASGSATYKGAALYWADRYFWQVIGYSDDYVYSPVRAFRVKGFIELGPLKPYDGRWEHNRYETGFKAQLACNFPEPPDVLLEVFRGSKRVDRQTFSGRGCRDRGRPSTMDIAYPGRKTASGVKLRAVVTVSSGDVKATRSVEFKAY